MHRFWVVWNAAILLFWMVDPRWVWKGPRGCLWAMVIWRKMLERRAAMTEQSTGSWEGDWRQ